MGFRVAHTLNPAKPFATSTPWASTGLGFSVEGLGYRVLGLGFTGGGGGGGGRVEG